MPKRKSARNEIFLNNEPSLQKKRMCSKSDGFKEILRRCCFIIGRDCDANELDADQAFFLKELEKILSSHSTRSVFLDGLEKMTEDEIRFKWSLMPSVTSVSCTTARSTCQDSLFHLLLNLEVIQEKVSKLLLEKLAEFALCESNDIFPAAEGKSLACMILLQFRWLNGLVNSTGFSSQLIDLVQVTPIEVQRDIVSLLPTILQEKDHSLIANNLTKILQENQELNVTILNTLSNLSIDEETLTSVRKKVLKTLPIAKFTDLPGIIRFVLMDLKVEDMSDTISELRNNLEFSPPFDPILSSTPIVCPDHLNDENNAFQIMNAVKLSLQIQKSLCDSWLKVLDKIHGPRKYKSFDFLVLLILYHFPSCQKKVEALLKNKIKDGELCEDLLSETFRNHHQALKEFILSLIELASILLRSADNSVSLFGISLYTKTFLSYDTFVKQEVVGALVSHVTNGTFLEINSALSTLLSLVVNHAQKMASFGIFVKSLLDYFNCLSLSQIQKVYEMLSFLSYKGKLENISSLEDDMLIIIRKQLMHRDLRYRKMGIIGALIAAKTACSKENDETPDIFIISGTAEKCEKAFSLLELIKSSVANSPEAEALFYDELSRLISAGSFPNSVEDWIDAHILNSFETSYIIDVPSNVNKPFSNEAELKFGLDDEPIAVNLHAVMKGSRKESLPDCHSISMNQTVSKKSTQSSKSDGMLSLLLKMFDSDNKRKTYQGSSTKQTSHLVLISMYRLLCIRRHKQDSCLTAIDALLCCPILLSEIQYKKFSLLPPRRKQMVLDAVFICINWFRETINAFSSVEDNETKLSVILRVQLLIGLQELLPKYLPGIDSYVPPVAHFDYDGGEALCFKAPQKKAKKKKSPKGRKGSKETQATQNTTVRTIDKSTELIESESDDSDAKVSSSFKQNLVPYFRELDTSVFRLLQLGPTFKKVCDPFSGERQRDLALHPSELMFLLEDLLSKLKHRFSSSFRARFKSAQHQVGFTNFDSLKDTDKIIKLCIDLVPALCHCIEECSNYFRNIMSESDEIIDPLILLSDDSQQISTCMIFLLNTFHCLLSWKGFLLDKNVAQLKEILRVFASREAQISEDPPLQDLVSYVIGYIVKFDDAVTSLAGASALIEFLEVIIIHSTDMESRKKISEVAKGFLRKSWFELNKQNAKTSETNRCIQIILEAYLKYSDDVLQSLEFLSNDALLKFVNDEEIESQDTAKLSTLRKSSLPAYCKIILSSLVDERKNYFKSNRDSNHEEVQVWMRAIKIFHALVNVIKTYDSRTVIHSSLVYGRQFISLFLKHGMPLLDKCFMNNKDDIISLLKNLQMSTRYMHHVCSHSKVLKDVSLTSQVPHVKKVLEHFVYRVKIMLAVNRCEEAFWIGNLKNRDLKGTEILSQTINEDSDEEEKANDSDSAASTVPLDSDKNSDDDDN